MDKSLLLELNGEALEIRVAHPRRQGLIRGNLRWVSADRQDKHKFYRNLRDFHILRAGKSFCCQTTPVTCRISK